MLVDAWFLVACCDIVVAWFFERQINYVYYKYKKNKNGIELIIYSFFSLKSASTTFSSPSFLVSPFCSPSGACGFASL